LGDCVLLPVANTTAELVARYIGERLRSDIQRTLGTRPKRLIVSVDECDGQQGVCELE
jgi:6-pyruvoyltetrahydropterin/6-carboxytetrahydropterin synthase